MPSNQLSSYDYIQNKISVMKETFHSLRRKTDDYVFSALSVRSTFYKNPAVVLNDSDFENIIVDGQRDGGVDVLLTDPNSEGSDLVIGQSKYYTAITFEEVVNAMLKMALFYDDMLQGHYENVNEHVQGRFLSLYSETGEESRIHFVFYTSAPQGGIRRDRVEKKFRDHFSDSSNIDVSIFFGSDIEENIKESESRRPTVEAGKIKIDKANNYLLYNEDAAIVNVSAFSIKSLYAQHNKNLLARNLRYHIKGQDIDRGITETINNNPDMFWMKNNGVTIICDDFSIDGKEVKLSNFSIVNGGQTTYMIHKNDKITEMNDLFLSCKIIRASGDTEDEKNAFSLEIAKATNSQKPIKPVDLKANSPEQVRFSQVMREAGVFYQTKRGEVVPTAFKLDYLNSDLLGIGKLCLAAIFQIPCTSRSKPSTLYQPQYYEVVFNGNQTQIARLCKELLYIDYYFRNKFQKRFDMENRGMPDDNIRISFAHNARTICIAFVAFASRVYSNNFTRDNLQTIFDITKRDTGNDSVLYDIFRNIEGMTSFLPESLFQDKDKYEEILYKLFSLIIGVGITSFSFECDYDSALNATNYLKKDKNYYKILRNHWATLSVGIKEVFDNIG